MLQGKSTEGIISKKELNALKSLIENGPSRNALVKTKKQPGKSTKVTATGKKPKKTRKSTHYLSQEISQNLNRTQMAINTLIPADLRSNVSKSRIVNHSLAIILREFEVKGKNSRLVRTIMQNI